MNNRKDGLNNEDKKIYQHFNHTHNGSRSVFGNDRGGRDNRNRDNRNRRNDNRAPRNAGNRAPREAKKEGGNA